MDMLLTILINLIVVGLVCYLLWWLIGFIGLPEPFDKVARVIIALIAVIYLLALVTGGVAPLPNLRIR